MQKNQLKGSEEFMCLTHIGFLRIMAPERRQCGQAGAEVTEIVHQSSLLQCSSRMNEMTNWLMASAAQQQC